MAGNQASPVYPYKWDSIARQRIPLWLFQDLTQIICALAVGATNPPDRSSAFGISLSDYEQIQRCMARLGFYVRRTAIQHAFHSFCQLGSSEIVSIGTRAKINNGIVPDGYRRLQDYVQRTGIKGIRFGSKEEAEDIIRLTKKPSSLVVRLDKYSLAMPVSVNRAIKIASTLELDDDEGADKAAKLEVQLWASMDDASRHLIEAEWQRLADLQATQRLTNGIPSVQEAPDLDANNRDLTADLIKNIYRRIKDHDIEKWLRGLPDSFPLGMQPEEIRERD